MQIGFNMQHTPNLLYFSRKIHINGENVFPTPLEWFPDLPYAFIQTGNRRRTFEMQIGFNMQHTPNLG